MTVSDNELINKFNNGDKDAFEELVNRYQHKVYNTTYRMLGNHEDAMDMAQETFLRVYKSLKKFKKNSSFSTWLFTITGNICRDKLRKRQREIKTYSLADDENSTKIIPENNDNKNIPEKVSISQEISEEIQEKVDLLPYEQKIVFVLREFEDFSYKEIADILDISIGTVKSRLSRARRSLRQDLYGIIQNGGIAL
ncbi:MAG: RNA polymerase sigma factor [Halanaerobiaceae bacterium]